jgi:hypothetical protein
MERMPNDDHQESQPAHAYVKCSCCGELIRNSPEENNDFGQNSYDEGFGMCFRCGGDPNSEDFRTRLGWGGQLFFDARIKEVREWLNPKNRAKFDVMDYELQVALVSRLIGRGIMI